jgi:hypothetical protein
MQFLWAEMISNKKVVNYKVSKLFEIYNFYFDSFISKVVWKTQKN